MSAYVVHQFCRRVLHDPAYRASLLTSPEQALDEFPFSPAQRAALQRGDVAWLYQNGAFAFLLLILSRFEVLGLDLPTYNERMRKLAGEPAHRKSPPGDAA